MTVYVVSTVESSGEINEIDRYSFNKLKAMRVAARLAGTRKCEPYGPTSIAYVGKTRTSVVSWK